MSFNGAGVFSINTAGQPVVAGTTISATVENALTADLATGLSTCLLKDGTQTATAVIPFVAGVTIPVSALGNAYSLTYTPTITAVANVAASTARLCTFLRVGNSVTVAGQCDIDPTVAAPTFTNFGLSLPVASDFSTNFQCGGTGTVDPTHGGVAVYIEADATNNRANVEYNASDAASQTIAFSFTYQVI